MSDAWEEYLWDPSAPVDPEIAELENFLQPYSARALQLERRELKFQRPAGRARSWPPFATAAAILAGVFVIGYLAHAFRLSWPASAPWPVTMSSEGRRESALLHVGQRLSTTARQTMTLRAARIGEVVLGERSAIKLLQSATGAHRLELEYGRLHAKIWAPPNYFGVDHGDASFRDLGCEFDLVIERSGAGRLAVTSGWVVYRHLNIEQLVPEGYVLSFDASTAQIPVRTAAPPEFKKALIDLERQLAAAAMRDSAHIDQLANRVAQSAHDADFFTLLSLLVREPVLARGALYSRLALALDRDPRDEAHRARWANGDLEAREEWWDRLPSQPKAWWLNWPDAF